MPFARELLQTDKISAFSDKPLPLKVSGGPHEGSHDEQNPLNSEWPDAVNGMHAVNFPMALAAIYHSEIACLDATDLPFRNRLLGCI